jgi:hypothetical protein
MLAAVAPVAPMELAKTAAPEQASLGEAVAAAEPEAQAPRQVPQAAELQVAMVERRKTVRRVVLGVLETHQGLPARKDRAAVALDTTSQAA